MVRMVRARYAALLLMPLWLLSAVAQKTSSTKFPGEITIGVHTFIDVGPPNDFYQIYILRASSHGADVERLTVTPAGTVCIQPPTVERATAHLDQSLPALLQGKNPCLIPEKALEKERARCKHCPVFSGADVNMQVQCGQATRTLRMDILDRDMFDPDPNTPPNTSQTMALLNKLDGVLGRGVLQRPMFDLSTHTSTKAHSEAIDELREGKFDALFKGDPDKPSQLYMESQKAYPAPTITLVSVSPIAPISPKFSPYPPIARLTHVEGLVRFGLKVSSIGTSSDIRFLSGPAMLKAYTIAAISKWKFSPAAAGKNIRGTIDFALNCPTAVH